jgi:hypothetical protein
MRFQQHELRPDAPSRSVTDVGPGDYVKIGRSWEKITSNSAHGAERTPRDWTVRTEDGGSHGMYGINRYAKAEDLETL